MIAKIIVAICVVDWLLASDSYGHVVAKFAVRLVSTMLDKAIA